MGEEKIIIYVKEETVSNLFKIINFMKQNARKTSQEMLHMAFNIESNFKIVEVDAFNSAMLNYEVLKVENKR
jgi:hypothetical protein